MKITPVMRLPLRLLPVRQFLEMTVEIASCVDDLAGTGHGCVELDAVGCIDMRFACDILAEFV